MDDEKTTNNIPPLNQQGVNKDMVQKIIGRIRTLDPMKEQEKTQPIRVENKEIKPFEPHPLDETEAITLTSEERVIRHQQMVEDIAEKAKTVEYKGIKDEYDKFPEDVVAAESYLTKRNENGVNYYAAAFAGQTLSEIDGLKRTSHVMYSNISYPGYFANLSQEDRQKYFAEVVVPNVKRVVVNVHGWGGRLLVFEEGNVKILNESKANVDPNSESEIPTPDNETLIISLDVMGSGQSLDKEHGQEFKEENIPEQVWEAIDRIGIQMTSLKLKSFASESRLREKILLTKDLSEAAKQGNIIENFENKGKIKKLLSINREYAEVANGVWWNNIIALQRGHSMGGTSTLNSAIANLVTERKQTIAFQQNLKERLRDTNAVWRTVVNLLRTNSQSVLSESAKEFDDLLYEPFKDTNVGEISLGHYPNKLYIAEVPVIFGDNATLNKTKENYSFIFEGQEEKETRRAFNKRIPLHTDVTSLGTIKAVHALSELENLKKIFLKAGDITKITELKLVHHIGRDAYGFGDIYASHAYTLNDETDFEKSCSRNLSQLGPVVSDTTYTQASIERWGEFLNSIWIIANNEDKTVGPALTKMLGHKFVEKLNKKTGETRDILVELPGSNHYPNMEGFAQIQQHIYESLKYFNDKRQSVISHVYFNKLRPLLEKMQEVPVAT